MRISELFRSIQGESTYAGLPCTFVRTAGCTLRCSYCDTGYALDPRSGEDLSLDTIVERVRDLGIDLVEITGGEPLEQADTPQLCHLLLDAGATVLVETSGAYPIDDLPIDTIKIMDIKTPSSRMAGRNDWENLKKISSRDELKFVIGDRADFDWAIAVCKEYTLFSRNPILFSPNYSILKPVILAEWILAERIPVRMQMQLHKLIWPPNQRGV